jgi:3-deoxy-7-phosphoheptulonate synthase
VIVVMKQGASKEDVRHLADAIRSWGLSPHISRGQERTVVGIIGDDALVRDKPLEVFPGVESVMNVVKPYKLASLESRPDRSLIEIPAPPGGQTVRFGGDKVVVIAGPCSIESREMLFALARRAKAAGADILRAGAFKPRTSPYAFQGLGVTGLRYLAEVRRELGMPVVTEVMDTRDVEMVADVADIVQVGARNMQNFNLLKVIGRCGKPVLLKRGLSNTIEELLMSAEYVLSGGNSRVLLCERGIRTFEKATRNTLDLSAVPVLKRESHLPVLVDPSHGTGYWDLVAPMARAAIAAGADGVLVEIHESPETALSDGPQALLPDTFDALMTQLRRIAEAIGRKV